METETAIDDQNTSTETQQDEQEEFIDTLQTNVRDQMEQLQKIKERRSDSERVGPKTATIEKSLADVLLAIRNLRQSTEIPEITLQFHPEIERIIAQARSEQRKPNVSELGDLVNASDFLNSLQNGVSHWITEIRRVTNMDRDPSSGTSLQESTFWINMERSLKKINYLRESDQVTLTLDALKHGKRFHATVSFDSDTGSYYYYTFIINKN